MILLDTHIWIWWVTNSARLTLKQQQLIAEHQPSGLGISIISCWEVAKLVENNKLDFSCSVDEWLDRALTYPGVRLINLSVPIAVESTQLAGFHRDPADQLIVATARILAIPLLTADRKILAYPGANAAAT